MLTKKQIRSIMLLRLRKQKEEDRDRKSKIIKEKLFKKPEFIKAKIVMFYISFDGEVDTKDMIREALKSGKIVAVPLCKKNGTIIPCILDKKAKLQRGHYGPYEPAIQRPINLEDLDLVIVPGVAFDKRANRLGRGKGCYDHLLQRLNPKIISIGLAFDFQILPSIPTTLRDIRVHKLIFA